MTKMSKMEKIIRKIMPDCIRADNLLELMERSSLHGRVIFPFKSSRMETYIVPLSEAAFWVCEQYWYHDREEPVLIGDTESEDWKTPAFGVWLFAERLKRFLSMEKFADLLRVAKNSVSYWENGETMPSLEHLRNMERIGIPVHEYFELIKKCSPSVLGKLK